MDKRSRHFPLIDISGNPYERGYSYGAQCAVRIRDTVRFYWKLFPQPAARLAALAQRYLLAIQQAAPELGEEIRGIGDGASVSQADIALLNARSELLGGMECTSLSFPGAKIMGQTWDWAERLEELAVILSILKPDGRRLLMLVEPGMVGKIGLNSSGIGVCINFLESPVSFTAGLPFHVLSRLVLEETSFDGAMSCIERFGGRAAGHLLIGSADGRGASVELAGHAGSIRLSNEILAHANRYLCLNGNEGFITRIDSNRRLARACGLAQAEDRTIEGLKRILQDRKGICSIYRCCLPSFNREGVGTIAVIAMDLNSGSFSIKKGYSREDHFQSIAV